MYVASKSMKRNVISLFNDFYFLVLNWNYATLDFRVQGKEEVWVKLEIIQGNFLFVYMNEEMFL